MANGNITIDEGTGKKTSAYSHSEDAETKYLQRHALNNSAGTEIATLSNPIRVDPTGVTAQPVSAASLPLPSGASTSANQSVEQTLVGAVTETAPATDTASSGLNGRLQRIAQRLTSLIASTLGFSVGAGTTDATTIRVVTASDGALNTNVGGVTETAPATDTASSGLNGRLQRIAQRLTSLIAVFTTGSGTSTAAIRVELPTNGTGAIATVSAVTAITNALPAGTNAIGKLAANSGVDIGDVDVTTVGTITPGTAASSLGKAQDGAHTSGDVGVMALGVSNEANTARAADGDYLPLATDTEGNVRNVGNRDHDAVDAGEPVKVGGRAISALSTATMVAAADRSDFITDLDGAQIVRPYCPIGDILRERLSNTDGAATASTVFGATASTKNCITTIIVHNAHATTNGYVDIRDGVAGTILMTIPLPATGGAVINLPVPLTTSANTALAFDVSAAISTIYISFVGFKSKA